MQVNFAVLAFRNLGVNLVGENDLVDWMKREFFLVICPIKFGIDDSQNIIDEKLAISFGQKDLGVVLEPYVGDGFQDGGGV